MERRKLLIQIGGGIIIVFTLAFIIQQTLPALVTKEDFKNGNYPITAGVYNIFLEKTLLVDVRTGQQFRFSDFKEKIVLIGTFKTNCYACLRQQQEIQKLLDELKGRKEIVAVSLAVGEGDNFQEVQRHLKNNNFNWYFAIAPVSLKERLVEQYGQKILDVYNSPLIISERGYAHFTHDWGLNSVLKLKREILGREVVLEEKSAAISPKVAERLKELNWDSKDALKVANKVRASTVCVVAKPNEKFARCAAAAFIVGKNLIATCAHCAHGHAEDEGEKETKNFAIKTITGRLMPVEEILETFEEHDDHDLALLRVASTTVALPPPLLSGSALPGEPVLAVGNPSQIGSWVVILGELLSTDSRSKDGFHARLPTRHGMSGSPVVNRYGEVIGVLTGGSAPGFVDEPFPLRILISLEDAVEEEATLSSGLILKEMIERHQKR